MHNVLRSFFVSFPKISSASFVFATASALMACSGAPPEEPPTTESQGAVTTPSASASPAVTRCAPGAILCHGSCIPEGNVCCPTTMHSCGDYCAPKGHLCM